MVACSLFLFAQEATPEEQLFALQDKAREANDKGDLVAVKQAYEEILKINDKDVGAREGLARVEAALADAAAKAAPAPEAPVTATATEPAPSPVPAAPATLIDQVTREREALYSEVESAIAEAEALAASGQYDKALRLLEEAGRALPNNTSAKVYRDKVLLARQDVIGARDAGGDEVERLANQRLRDVARRNQEKIDVVEARISEARSLVRKGGLENLDLADATLDAANKDRPRNISTEPLDEEIKDIRKLIVSERINRAIEARELAKVPPLLEMLRGRSLLAASRVASARSRFSSPPLRTSERASAMRDSTTSIFSWLRRATSRRRWLARRSTSSPPESRAPMTSWRARRTLSR